MSDFAMHQLPVGGGVLALSPLPGRGGNYAADFAHITQWRPDLVVSMTPQAEMDSHGAESFGDDLHRAGIRWLHLPVADFGVPQDLDWPQVRDSALGVLQGRGRVLVHCFGGCGRSGMIGLRLMIAVGENAEAALGRLRATRPCAVETGAQLAWANQGR